MHASIKTSFYKHKKAQNTLTIQKLTVEFDGKSVTTRQHCKHKKHKKDWLTHTSQSTLLFAVQCDVADAPPNHGVERADRTSTDVPS